MSSVLHSVIIETVQVTFFVFTMMVIVDLVNLWTRGKIIYFLRKGREWRQYVVTSLIGAMPGCFGAFTNVSLYVHGMISFGALTGAMAAASGDEAFVMLAMFPKTALILFALLFLIGIAVGFVTDRIVKKMKIQTCQDCGEQLIHDTHGGFSHYLKEHVWHHIVKRHLWKTALWTFGALIVVRMGMETWDLSSITAEYTLGLFFLGALLGLIPESGPHLIFVTMFANGLIPFSVLFTSSFVQDGHGMLPLLSYSVKDSILVKVFNLSFGLALGLVLYAFGF